MTSNVTRTGCEHFNFQANVKVARLEDHETSKVTGFMAEIVIHCVECGVKFQFLGLEPGLDMQGARVSLDGLEANIAICPEGTKPNPFQRLRYDIKSFT